MSSRRRVTWGQAFRQAREVINRDRTGALVLAGVIWLGIALAVGSWLGWR